MAKKGIAAWGAARLANGVLLWPAPAGRARRIWRRVRQDRRDKLPHQQPTRTSKRKPEQWPPSTKYLVLSTSSNQFAQRPSSLNFEPGTLNRTAPSFSRHAHSSTRYIADRVRRMSALPVTAGLAMKPSSNLFL